MMSKARQKIEHTGLKNPIDAYLVKLFIGIETVDAQIEMLPPEAKAAFPKTLSRISEKAKMGLKLSELLAIVNQDQGMESELKFYSKLIGQPTFERPIGKTNLSNRLRILRDEKGLIKRVTNGRRYKLAKNVHRAWKLKDIRKQIEHAEASSIVMSDDAKVFLVFNRPLSTNERQKLDPLMANIVRLRDQAYKQLEKHPVVVLNPNPSELDMLFKLMLKQKKANVSMFEEADPDFSQLDELMKLILDMEFADNPELRPLFDSMVSLASDYLRNPTLNE